MTHRRPAGEIVGRDGFALPPCGLTETEITKRTLQAWARSPEEPLWPVAGILEMEDVIKAYYERQGVGDLYEEKVPRKEQRAVQFLCTGSWNEPERESAPARCVFDGLQDIATARVYSGPRAGPVEMRLAGDLVLNTG